MDSHMGEKNGTHTAFVVTEGSYSDYHIVRVYLDRDEAQAFVDAYNGTLERRWKFVSDEYTLEEWTIGAPRVEMDGPIWEGTWHRQRVEKPGQRSPGYFEFFQPVEYSDEWTESFKVYEVWHVGPTPPKAEVTHSSGPHPNSAAMGFTAIARGTSKEHVEKALQDTAAQMKAQHAGIA